MAVSLFQQIEDLDVEVAYRLQEIHKRLPPHMCKQADALLSILLDNRETLRFLGEQEPARPAPPQTVS